MVSDWHAALYLLLCVVNLTPLTQPSEYPLRGTVRVSYMAEGT